MEVSIFPVLLLAENGRICQMLIILTPLYITGLMLFCHAQEMKKKKYCLNRLGLLDYINMTFKL